MERLSLRRRLLICYGAGTAQGPLQLEVDRTPDQEYEPHCHSRQRTRPGLLEAFPGLWLKQGPSNSPGRVRDPVSGSAH